MQASLLYVLHIWRFSVHKWVIGKNRYGANFPLNYRSPLAPKLHVGSEKVFGVQKWYGYVLSACTVWWHQEEWTDDVAFHLKCAVKVTIPIEKLNSTQLYCNILAAEQLNSRLRPISAYNVSTVRASETSSIIANRKSTTRFPTSCAYVTPNYPKVCSKK